MRPVTFEATVTMSKPRELMTTKSTSEVTAVLGAGVRQTAWGDEARGRGTRSRRVKRTRASVTSTGNHSLQKTSDDQSD